ncbi:Stealth CR1 domain-containing protein [Legionella tunisiensis]|uniref:Stealth CR1 domain-containing protein n=1 Tax=Legionella tunisiensis TaxID=1034944 RepID=UPI0002F687DE|nr:Stealth CR1 domain-containing protein [Legionella tunisiensis]
MSRYSSNEPVDAVITWVDGYDKVHAEKLASYLAKIGLDKRPETASPTRFNQQGELDYCVHSLLRFAPWLRTIYIVTDAQTPSLMKTLVGTPHENKVKLIDHRDIFWF